MHFLIFTSLFLPLLTIKSGLLSWTRGLYAVRHSPGSAFLGRYSHKEGWVAGYGGWPAPPVRGFHRKHFPLHTFPHPASY